MYSIAKASANERDTLFENTAAKKGVNATIVEKDFWVVLTLDYLFRKSRWKDYLAFKGGTSLSKAYQLIERFSEDIDLILDWRLLGYAKDEPWETMSRTKRERFIDDAHNREDTFFRDEITPQLRDGLSEIVGDAANVYYDRSQAKPGEPGFVCFEYPGSYSDLSILRSIRLEIGALASWTPTQKVTFSSYAAEEYPGFFQQGSTEVLTTTAERTFWEKATILHREAMRTQDKGEVPTRYSRHYYDMYCMSKNPVCERALAQPELLDKVAEFKDRFYYQGWAKYNQAKVGSIRLVPPEYSIEVLKRDYADMRSMIYGDYPSFDEIIDTMGDLEDRINGEPKNGSLTWEDVIRDS